MSQPSIPLTRAELDELDEMLAAPDIEENSMDAAALEGFCAALAYGPGSLPEERWLPYVWDMARQRARPTFVDRAGQHRAHELITRMHADVAFRLRDDPAAFVPLFQRGDQWGVMEWCAGFLLGTSLEPGTWRALIDAEPDWLQPVVTLGMGDEEECEAIFENVDAAMAAVSAALTTLFGRRRR